jgi:uncharacterized iron-regulated membrane protein
MAVDTPVDLSPDAVQVTALAQGRDNRGGVNHNDRTRHPGQVQSRRLRVVALYAWQVRFRPRALIKALRYPPAGPMRARLAISDQNERIWLARNPCQGAVLRPTRGRRTSMYW